MSWFNRILSGTRRLASAVIPESVQRKLTDFSNWPTGYVEPE